MFTISLMVSINSCTNKIKWEYEDIINLKKKKDFKKRWDKYVKCDKLYGEIRFKYIYVLLFISAYVYKYFRWFEKNNNKIKRKNVLPLISHFKEGYLFIYLFIYHNYCFRYICYL